MTIDVTEWVRALDKDAQIFSVAVCDAKGWELAFVSREGAQNMTEADADMAPSLLLSVKKNSEGNTGGNTPPGDNEGSGDNKNPGDNTPPANNPPAKVKVKKVSVSAPSKQIAAGKKVALKADVTPKKASNPAVKWTSSNKKYAAVNSKGVVTTKRAGKGKTVTIKATARDGSNKYASVRIKIMKNAVKKVTIKNKPKTLKAGKKITLKTVVKAEGKNGKTVNKTLKWSSSNKKYAVVTSKGKVTAKRAGKGKTVTIRVVSTDGTNKKASVKIIIR